MNKNGGDVVKHGHELGLRQVSVLIHPHGQAFGALECLTTPTVSPFSPFLAPFEVLNIDVSTVTTHNLRDEAHCSSTPGV
jgi:hypothetical protein